MRVLKSADTAQAEVFSFAPINSKRLFTAAYNLLFTSSCAGPTRQRVEARDAGEMGKLAVSHPAGRQIFLGYRPAERDAIAFLNFRAIHATTMSCVRAVWSGEFRCVEPGGSWRPQAKVFLRR
jgi:hypothetical protein